MTIPKLALKYQPVGKWSRGRHKEMEGPVLGRQLRNKGLTNTVNSSRKRRGRKRVWSVLMRLSWQALCGSRWHPQLWHLLRLCISAGIEACTDGFNDHVMMLVNVWRNVPTSKFASPASLAIIIQLQDNEKCVTTVLILKWVNDQGFQNLLCSLAQQPLYKLIWKYQSLFRAKVGVRTGDLLGL
jgi:hypothetical protein